MIKSPRDNQQLDYIGRQLNVLIILQNVYELATEDNFGHLLIDLDPRTTYCLRYCLNIITPGPSIFFLLLNKPEVTPITSEREKIICSAAHGTVERKSTTVFFKSHLLSVPYERLLNVVNGNVPVSLPNLNNFEI